MWGIPVTVIFGDSLSILMNQFPAVGAKVVRPSPDPTKVGYTFDAWYKDASTEPYDFTETVGRYDFTLNAKWIINKYKVTFDARGGTSTSPITVNHGDTITLPSEPTRIGYTFIGWYTAANGGGSPFTASTEVMGDITVYAKWTINNYEVTFDAQGGTSTSSITVNHGDTIALPSEPTRTGYDFDGWYTAANGGGYQFTASTPVTADITIYAKWTINIYTVTFDARGGTSTAPITAEYEATITLPSVPTRTDYIFDGWFTEQNGGGSPFTDSIPVTADITVYAQWHIQTWTGDINITQPDLNDVDFTFTFNPTDLPSLSKSAGGTDSLTATSMPTGVSVDRWQVYNRQGVLQREFVSTASITLSAADYSYGTYTVMLIVKKNGVPYSGSASFMVIP
jgi:uncharacterized repeat protein (TIGR02543 family)